MPYLRCNSCGRDELYSPRRFVRRACPECHGDLAFDRPLTVYDRPADGPPSDGEPRDLQAGVALLTRLLRSRT